MDTMQTQLCIKLRNLIREALKGVFQYLCSYTQVATF